MTETPMPVEFDPETLETVGVADHASDLGDLTTAHPHYDDGYVYNYVTKFGRRSEYRVYRRPEDGGEREVVASIPRDEPSYMHSFGLTESYVVLVEFPFVVRPLDLLLRDRPFVENYRWRPGRGTRFTLVDRASGEVAAESTTEAFFSFHHVNAFERDDEVTVDLLRYDDPSIVDDLMLEELRSPELSPDGARLERYRLSVDGVPGDEAPAEVESETLYGGPMELPRTNYDAVNTRPYTYVYGVGNRERPPEDLPNTLLKVDVESGDTTTWEEPGTYPGEPVFVEAPDAAAEDDGVVLSVVLEPRNERSFLLALDAASFEELGRATVPHHVPFGFHGGFFDL